MGTETDRIEKKVLLRAPLERVWRAVSDAREFGSWFGVDFDGSFALLTVTETGFDHVPLARRAKALTMNEHGWSAQTRLIEKYLAHAA